MRTLRDIEKALADVPVPQRERVAANIYQEGHYLPRLLEVFRECEDREDREALSNLYGIIKCLIMMNDMQLVELMVTDGCFNDVVGCLEYDPDLAPSKAEHRKFLKVCLCCCCRRRCCRCRPGGLHVCVRGRCRCCCCSDGL